MIRPTDERLTMLGQRQLIEQFVDLVRHRSEQEFAILQDYSARDARLTAQFEFQRQQLESEHVGEPASNQQQREQALAALRKEYEQRKQRLSAKLAQATRKIRSRSKARMRAAGADRERAVAQANEKFQIKHQKVEHELASRAEIFALQLAEIGELAAQAELLLKSAASDSSDDGIDEFGYDDPTASAHKRCGASLARAKTLKDEMQQASGSRKTAARVPGMFREFRQSLRAAEAAAREAFADARGKLQPKLDALATEHTRSLRQAESDFNKATSILKTMRDRRTAENREKVRQRHRQDVTLRDQQLEQLLQATSPKSNACADNSARIAELSELHQQELARSKEQYEQQWSELKQQWHGGVTRFGDDADALHIDDAEALPTWEQIAGGHWQSPSAQPEVVCLANYVVRMDDLPGGRPDEPDLLVERTDFSFPAALTLPGCSSLLVKTEGEFDGAANDVLHAAALQLLAAYPQGELQLTVIDPLDQWGDVAALAMEYFFDHPAPPVRVWTDAEEISLGLRELADSLADSAEQVQAARHLIVLGSFPLGFNEEDTQRLIEIAKTASQTGDVSLLAAIDAAQTPASKALTAALSPAALAVRIEEGRPRLDDEVLGQFPLTFHNAPDDAAVSGLLHAMGGAELEAALSASWLNANGQA